jgi:hypothetical protein
MRTIKINNSSYEYSGKSLVIKDAKVFIDGKQINVEEKVINITIEGNCDNIEADYCHKISVTGNASSVKSMSGDIEIGKDVAGGVESASGDITVKGNISGGASSMSGDIECGGTLFGGASTMSGDVTHK